MKFWSLMTPFSFSVSHSVMLEQWIFNAFNIVLLNATIGFLTGRRNFTVCDILCRVIWSTLDTHTPTKTKSTYWVHLPFSKVLSSSTTYCFRTRKKRGGRDCIGYKDRAVGYGGILWNPLESQALMGLIPLSTYKHYKDSTLPLTTQVSFMLCMRLFHCFLNPKSKLGFCDI